MKFGIIACPNCKKVKGVNLSCKTTRCARCGKILLLKKIKLLYETDSEQKLRQAIGVINAKIDGKLDDYYTINKE